MRRDFIVPHYFFSVGLLSFTHLLSVDWPTWKNLHDSLKWKPRRTFFFFGSVIVSFHQFAIGTTNGWWDATPAMQRWESAAFLYINSLCVGKNCILFPFFFRKMKVLIARESSFVLPRCTATAVAVHTREYNDLYPYWLATAYPFVLSKLLDSNWYLQPFFFLKIYPQSFYRMIICPKACPQKSYLLPCALFWLLSASTIFEVWFF